MEDLYTKVFVKTELNKEELFNLIMDITKGKRIVHRSIELDSFEIVLCENDEYKYKKKNGEKFDEDNFLFYPFFVELLPLNNISKEKFISSLDEFLSKLSTYDIKILTACDFEDELKNNGNYNI